MDAQTILERLNACSIPVSIREAEQIAVYHRLLLDWNTRMDLTAVTEDSEMLDRHYVDSLMALTQPGLLPVSGRVIDVGTGAGFPGMPLAICCPDLRFTLLDSQQKRLNFLSAVIAELGLQNVTLVHARAEDGARNPELRASFDAAVARAVAPLPVCCPRSWTAPDPRTAVRTGLSGHCLSPGSARTPPVSRACSLPGAPSMTCPLL